MVSLPFGTFLGAIFQYLTLFGSLQKVTFQQNIPSVQFQTQNFGFGMLPNRQPSGGHFLGNPLALKYRITIEIWVRKVSISISVQYRNFEILETCSLSISLAQAYQLSFLLKTQGEKTETQEHERQNSRNFLQKLSIPAILYHVYAYFLVKKYAFQTILLKITNIFEKKLKNFLKTLRKFPKYSIFRQIQYPCLPEKCPNDKPTLAFTPCWLLITYFTKTKYISKS